MVPGGHCAEDPRRSCGRDAGGGKDRVEEALCRHGGSGGTLRPRKVVLPALPFDNDSPAECVLQPADTCVLRTIGKYHGLGVEALC